MTSGAAHSSDAEDALARDYALLRGEVVGALRGKLTAQRVHVDDGDLDEVYNQAWHALYMQLKDGVAVESRAGFLVTVGYRRAIDELRRAHPGRTELGGDVATLGAEHDIAQQLDDATRVRHLMEGFRERLDAREQQAAALCLIHGYTRPEAAAALGHSPRRMEKIMDGVMRKLARLTDDIADDWCRSRASLIAAYALGLLEEGGERHAAAVEHLRDCSACRRSVNQRRGLAGVLPPIGLPLVLGGALATGGAGAGAGGGFGADLLSRIGIGRVPADGVAHSGSHVVAAATAGGLATAAIVVLATGGGPLHGRSHGEGDVPAAAVEQTIVTPVRTSTQAAPRRRLPRHAATRPRRRHAATTPAATAPQATTPAATPTTPAPTPTPSPSPTPTPTPTPTPQAADPAPSAQSKPAVVTDGAQEFGPER